MNEKIYPSDLTDEEWEWIKDLIPAAKSGGRPRTLCMRAVLNAIFYVTKGGIQWRMLPTNFPKWQSVYHYLRAWKLQGVWVRIHDTLRARVREKEERHKHPTAGCLDSNCDRRLPVRPSRRTENLQADARHLQETAQSVGGWHVSWSGVDCLGQRAIPYSTGIRRTRGRTKRLRCVTASVGSGKNIGMVEPMSSIEQRLRRVTNHQ